LCVAAVEFGAKASDEQRAGKGQKSHRRPPEAVDVKPLCSREIQCLSRS
jgi:hypothetical protein